jgi:hypothetical protein
MGSCLDQAAIPRAVRYFQSWRNSHGYIHGNRASTNLRTAASVISCGMTRGPYVPDRRVGLSFSILTPMQALAAICSPSVGRERAA